MKIRCKWYSHCMVSSRWHARTGRVAGRRYSGRGEVMPSHSHPLRRPSPPGHSHKTRWWPGRGGQIDRSPSHRIALLVGLRDEPNLGLFLVSGSSPKQPSQPFSSGQRFPVVSFLRPHAAHLPMFSPRAELLDDGRYCRTCGLCFSSILFLQLFLPQGGLVPPDAGFARYLS